MPEWYPVPYVSASSILHNNKLPSKKKNSIAGGTTIIKIKYIIFLSPLVKNINIYIYIFGLKKKNSKDGVYSQSGHVPLACPYFVSY